MENRCRRVPGLRSLLSDQYLHEEQVFTSTEPLRRALFIAFILLIGGGLIVPTAQATFFHPHARYRFFQDLSVTSPFPGRILFGVLFKQNRHGEFTPRRAVGYRLQVGVSCNPGGNSAFSIGGNGFSKYAYFSAKLIKGRFFHAFGSEVPDGGLSTKGDLRAKVLKKRKRNGRVTRKARVNGTFNVEDWDPYGLAGVQENCTSAGSYSAPTCKPPRMSPQSPKYNRWKRWKVPKCFASLW